MQFALARHARRLIIKDSTVSAFLDHFQQKMHFHLFYIIIPIYVFTYFHFTLTIIITWTLAYIFIGLSFLSDFLIAKNF